MVTEGRSSKPKAMTLAYTQAFSKRTTGYVGFAYVDYDNLDWGASRHAYGK